MKLRYTMEIVKIVNKTIKVDLHNDAVYGD